MKRPEFLRPVYLVVGAVAAALAGWLVPADSWRAQLALVLFAGVFFAYGAWSMRDAWGALADTGRDLGAWWRRRRKSSSPVPTGPLPDLAPALQEQVRHCVAVMAAHGLFKPEVPNAELLFAPLAGAEGRAGPDDILQALEEVVHYHPTAQPANWMANLLLQDGHAEQLEDALQLQVQDIVRMSEGALELEDLRITLSPRAGGGSSGNVQVQVQMTVNGERIQLNYPGHSKTFSTHLQHALALRLALQGHGLRLACLYMGELMVFSVLKDGAVEALNRELRLGARSTCHWAWVDEQEPVDTRSIAV